MLDFILNGQPHGSVAERLLDCDFQVGALRPFKHNGRTFITVNQDGKDLILPVNNATALLRRDDWILLDEVVIEAAKPRLNFVADLRSRPGLTFNIPNGLSKTVLQYESVSDISEATTSMDGLRESEADRPYFDIANLPLPIIHKDFHFSARQLAVSRNGGSPLDTTTAALAARRVAEEAEKLALGVSSTYSYGGGTIYGMVNYTGRMTKSMTLPTAGGWTPATTVAEVLQMRLQAQNAYHYGPYMLYTSLNWDPYLDDDYSAAKGDLTLRDRLMKIEGIQGIKTLDYLTGYKMVLVQMTPDVVQEVVGMDISTVQWTTHGGMMVHFKVMGILVPRFRGDIYGNTGIVDGTAA